MKFALTDSCFWIGLLDSRDQHHEASVIISELLDNATLVVPYPCLYESVNTHLERINGAKKYFEKLLSKPNVEIFSDVNYRDSALDNVLKGNKSGFKSNHSLVDEVLRLIVLDNNIKLDYLVSFNTRDFADVCSAVGLELVDG